jgi:DNA repair protein RAD5
VLSSENESDSASGDGEVDIDSMIRKFSKEEDASESSSSNAFAEGVLTNLNDLDNNGECPICLDVMQSPMFLPVCMHQWCAFLGLYFHGSLKRHQLQGLYCLLPRIL